MKILSPIDEDLDIVNSKSKVSLPMNGAIPNKGNIGDFAVSDGNGGITWQKLINRAEVGA